MDFLVFQRFQIIIISLKFLFTETTIYQNKNFFSDIQISLFNITNFYVKILINFFLLI
jgi:hypothetical protein